MKKKRILMFIMGKWSHSNAAIVDALQDKLPHHEIRVIDLLQQFKRDKRGLIACLLDIPVLAWNALIDRDFDKTDILYAPATSRFINRMARRFTLEYQPDFTIQTTTRFNASTGLVPHFTVIDITVAAARQGYCDLFNSTERALDRLHLFQQQVYSASTAVFAMSRYVRNSLVWDYLVTPYRAINIGAGPNIMLGQRSPLLGSRNILFVGTDWVRKGGPTLLAAFRLLRKNHPQATLNIIGCRPDINEPGVNIIGRVAREHLHKHFTEARVFALPTVHEALGIAFIEALHFGLPIVATGINAIPEIVEDGVNGYIIQPGDVDGLANALDQILSSDKIALAFGNAAYARASHFTWDRAGKVLSENILQLIKLDQEIDQGTSKSTSHYDSHAQAQEAIRCTLLQPDNKQADRARRPSWYEDIFSETRSILHSMQTGISMLLKYF